MSKSNTFENDLLLAIFNAVGIANLLDNAASGPLTHLQVGFHTGDPGEAGNQTTNECTYTSYARVAVVRTSSGWVVTGNVVNPAARITAPQATGGNETVTHFSVGTASSGAGKVLYKGTVTPNIAVSNGVSPFLETTTSITED
jgi:hypothetical protein